MKTLLELNRELIQAEEELETINAEYSKAKTANKQKQKNIKEQIIYAKRSVDISKIKKGLELLELKFPTMRSNISQKKYTMIYDDIVKDAKADIATGGEKLRRGYFGQKYYGGYDQRSDHPYGYGPRHGGIYQSIGLRKPEEAMTDEQAEVCLYVLENLSVIMEARNENQF